MMRGSPFVLLLATALSVGLTAHAEPGGGLTGTTLEQTSTSPTLRSMDSSDSFHHHHWGFGPYRSPGLAFVLSLTPVPVDFGNLYAQNTEWGIVYTSAELALGGSMLWVGADHMCHSNDCDSWSDGERRTMLGLVFGYVAVKLGAGIHATFAAEDFNTRQNSSVSPMILATADGVVIGWQRRY